jgi:polar amino acid transport system substrate-binding protein
MKIIFAIICLFLASSSAYCQKKELLKIAIYDFRPHVFVDPKETVPTGAAIDLLIDTLGINRLYQVQWVASPFSRFLADMESGKADMGLFLAKTPDREKKMRYSYRPVFTTESGIILPQSTNFTDLKSIQGQVLGHTQSSVEPKYFKDLVKFDRLSGEQVVERNLNRLKLKRIDGVFIPTFSNGQYVLKTHGLEDGFKIMKIPNTSLDLYFVFRKDISEKTFTLINELLNKKHSFYAPLLDKYLGPQETASIKAGPK